MKLFYRVHWNTLPALSAENAESRPWGEEDAEPVRGYSSCTSIGWLFDYFSQRCQPAPEDAQIVEFSGVAVGVGPDNEALVVPDGRWVRVIPHDVYLRVGPQIAAEGYSTFF